MPKRTHSSGLSRTEKTAGFVFFVLYFLVMPLLFSKLIGVIETLFALNLSDMTESAIYYYLIFAVTILIFHRYLWATTDRFLNNIGRSASTWIIGLLTFYGGNELIYRATRLFMHNSVNLNDVSIAAQINSAPRMTWLIVVLMAPFVEEVLFRSFVFGILKEKHRILAYLVSAILFSFVHVWQYFLNGWDFTYLILMLQYLFPSFVFAWAYDHSGNLWCPFFLHATVNALSLFLITG